MSGGYKCFECKANKNEGDEFYSVLDVDGFYLSCCSMECATKKQKEIVQKAKDNVVKVKGYIIEKLIW